MATELPVRINFQLPDGWHAAPPDEVGAPGVAFVAIHPASHKGFTANLTVAGQIREPELPMHAIADESLHRVQQSLPHAAVLQRDQIGTDSTPGIVQKLELVTTVENESLTLLQCQVYVSMHDVNDPSTRAVVELALTCTPNQLDDVFDDFQTFVQSIRPGEADSPEQ